MTLLQYAIYVPLCLLIGTTAQLGRGRPLIRALTMLVLVVALAEVLQ